MVPGDTYHFDYVKEQKYGYPSEAANATQLTRTFYKIKVKDANLIDNDHKFVAINNQYKYVVATENEIIDPKNHLSFAIVTLKENNCLTLNGEEVHGYALVNSPAYVKVNATKEEDLKGLKLIDNKVQPEYCTDEYGNQYEAYYKDVKDNGSYDPDHGDVIMVKRVIDNRQVTGKLGVEVCKQR